MAFIPVYILILFFTIAIDYAAGLLIENAEGRARKMWLVMSIFANVGVLAVFKYFNFLTANANAIAEVFHWPYEFPILGIILPIGLSFHTFQAMSYTIEVYRGRQPAEKNLGIYALYVMYFPQLVAGPIERPQNLLHQFRTPQRLDVARLRDGLALALWGLFKKVVVADSLALYVDAVYGASARHTGATLLLGTWCFAFQIYCDFSGYSDIARGVSRL